MVLEEKSMQESMPAPAALGSRRLVQILVVVFLTALLAIAALPDYFSGTWPWSAPLQVPQIEQLRQLKDQPLPLSDWETLNHTVINLSGEDWSLTEYIPTQPTDPDVPGLALLLRPQTWHTNQPEVEWVDIAGSQTWRMEHRRILRFSVPSSGGDNITVTAQYFRARNEQSTFAVMQWYGWPEGGHPSPGRWFWLDQRQQWQHRARQPWVAVSLMMPIEPVGDVLPYQPLMLQLGQQVQQALDQGVFAGMDPE